MPPAAAQKIIEIDVPAVQAKMGLVPFLINLQREQTDFKFTVMILHAIPR